MAESEYELRARLRALQERIERDRATFTERLAYANAVIAHLREDRAWLRSVADDRDDRIAALEAQLDAARLQLVALRASGTKDKWRISRAVATTLAGIAAIADFSGYTMKDLIQPTEPLSALMVSVGPHDRQWLGINEPGSAAVSGSAVRAGFQATARGVVTTPIPPIAPGADIVVHGVHIRNRTVDDVAGQLSTDPIIEGSWFNPWEKQVLLVADRPGESVTVENGSEERVCVLLTVGQVKLQAPRGVKAL